MALQSLCCASAFCLHLCLLPASQCFTHLLAACIKGMVWRQTRTFPVERLSKQCVGQCKLQSQAKPVGCRGDLKSCTLEDVLKIRFAENGKLQVKLVAEVIFPNVELSKSALPFGHVLSSSTAHRYVVMKNSSKAPVSYKWFMRLAEPKGAPNIMWLNAATQMELALAATAAGWVCPAMLKIWHSESVMLPWRSSHSTTCACKCISAQDTSQPCVAEKASSSCNLCFLANAASVGRSFYPA